MKKNICFVKFGFTLAEVLITLGVIGVVAAMSIPTLQAKIQRKIYGAKLIQTHAILTQGFKRYLATNEVDLLSETPAFDSVQDSGISICDPSNWNNPSCQEFVSEMSHIFSGISLNKTGTITYKYLKGSGTGTRGPWGFTFPNGAIVYIGVSKNYNTTSKLAQVQKYGTKLITAVAYVDIDINGKSSPNQWGRDFFEFQLSNDGFLFPEGGRDYSVFRNGNLNVMYNSQNLNWWSCMPENGKNPRGWGCGARVLEEKGMYY